MTYIALLCIIYDVGMQNFMEGHGLRAGNSLLRLTEAVSGDSLYYSESHPANGNVGYDLFESSLVKNRASIIGDMMKPVNHIDVFCFDSQLSLLYNSSESRKT